MTTMSNRQRMAKRKAEAAKDGGLIQVSFTFAGKKHVQNHRLTQSEMDAQQELLRENGADAFSTATLQVSIWGAGQLGRHCVMEAFKDYARLNHRPHSQNIYDRQDYRQDYSDETTLRITDDSDPSGSDAPTHDGYDKSGVSTSDERSTDAATLAGESPSVDKLPGDSTSPGR